MKALDISYGSAKVTAAWCQARRSEGYQLLVADLWSGSKGFPAAAQALRRWREAGGVTAGYLVIHRYRNLDEHYAGAKASAGDEWDKLAFVAVDIERVDRNSALPGQATPEMTRQACDRIAAEGLRPIVYTSHGMWTGIMGPSQALSDQPLWDAHYGTATKPIPANLTVSPGYGVWTVRTGHQFKDTTDVDGIPCDLN